MMRVARWLPWLVGSLYIIAVGTAAAQPGGTIPAYPAKPIRIVTAGPGGGNEFAARLIAQGITDSLGQPVVLDNRPTGIIPGQVASKAAPDGYTLLFSSGSLWIGPLLQNNVPYDPVRDFMPISLTNRAPNILVVHPSLPVRSVQDLIALAKARPGELNYSASGAVGSSSHLAAELFKSMAGVQIVRVPYKSGAQETADLIGGQVQLTFSAAAQVSSHIKSGRLRALAVTTASPSVLFPQLPTIAGSGVPGYEAGATSGMFAPARTPAVIVARLHDEIVKALHMPEIKDKFLSAGVEPVGSSPDDFAAAIKKEITKLGKVIKDAGIGGD